MKKLKKYFHLRHLVPFLIFGSPVIVNAQGVDTGELLNPLAGLFGRQANLSVILTGITRVLLIVAGLVAFIYLIIGGYQYVTAGGNAEQAQAARTTILNAIIGLVIILGSYALITWFLIRFLAA